jgi:hypothetical protein
MRNSTTNDLNDAEIHRDMIICQLTVSQSQLRIISVIKGFRVPAAAALISPAVQLLVPVLPALGLPLQLPFGRLLRPGLLPLVSGLPSCRRRRPGEEFNNFNY